MPWITNESANTQPSRCDEPYLTNTVAIIGSLNVVAAELDR